jgi:chromosome segregation ATPase
MKHLYKRRTVGKRTMYRATPNVAELNHTIDRQANRIKQLEIMLTASDKLNNTLKDRNTCLDAQLVANAEEIRKLEETIQSMNLYMREFVVREQTLSDENQLNKARLAETKYCLREAKTRISALEGMLGVEQPKKISSAANILPTMMRKRMLLLVQYNKYLFFCHRLLATYARALTYA